MNKVYVLLQRVLCFSKKKKKKKKANNNVTQQKFFDVFNRDIHNSNLPSPIVFIKPFFLIKEKYEKLQLMVELGVQFREGKD